MINSTFLKNKIVRSPATLQTVITTSANYLSAVIMAVAMIVLARVMGPRNFGIFSVSMSLMFILMRIIDAGFSQVIPRFIGNWHQQPSKQTSLLSYILFWKVILASVLLLCSIVFLPVISRVLDYPHAGMIIYSFFGAVGLALYNYVYSLLSAKLAFIEAGLINVSQSLVKAIAFIFIIFYWQSNLEAIAVSYYLAPFATSIVFLMIYKEKLLYIPKLLTGSTKKEVDKFWLHAAISVITASIIANIDVLLVQRYLGESSAGVYAGAVRIVSFFGMLAVSISTVLNSRVARYRDKETLLKYLKKAKILVILPVVLSLLFLPISKFLIIYTLGVDFLSAQTVLQILLINSFLSILILPLTAVFFAIDRASYFSINGLIQVVLILLASWLLIPQFGMLAVALSKVLATVVSLFYSYSLVKSELDSSD